MSTPRFSGAASLRALLCLGVAAAGVTALVGCDESETNQQTTTCDARAVQVQNADGTCTWVSSCDVDGQTLCGDTEEYQCETIPADACNLDARCEAVTTTVCPGCDPVAGSSGCECTTSSRCDEKPSDDCGTLDEMSCIASSACVAEYGWSDGTSTARPDGSGDPAPGALPAPPEPDWGFLGCIDASTGSCGDLELMACEAHPSCQPIWGSNCPPCAPGQDCICDTSATYVGCEQLPSETCDGLIDPVACDSAAGCHWEYAFGGAPAPCECTPDNPDCGCDVPAPIPSDGYCVADYPVDSCADIGDEGTCVAVGCEWLGTGTDQPVCECAPDDTECMSNCTSLAPEPVGSCVAPAPDCYDHYDEFACLDNGCQWTRFDGTDPAPEPDPCTCPPDDPTCGCSGLIAPADGYCEPPTTNPCNAYGEATTCRSDERCDWYDAPDMMRPACDPNDPECSDDFFACPTDAAFDPSGLCTGADGIELPDFCCDGGTGGEGVCDYKETQPGDPCEENGDEFTCNSAPDCEWLPAPCLPDEPTCADAGICTSESVQPPLTCADASDAATCTDLGCEWADVACDCDPAIDPMCECPDGLCQEPTPQSCDVIGDPTTCDATTGCAWDDAAGLIACDPESRFDAEGVCTDSLGNPQPDFCCDGSSDPPAGMCIAAP